ncbi:MAG: hypothetical protein PQJ50_14005 [Spirochaetales bacterium]|nr:hypothetical protein [Spirochaetales bacterium]
MDSTTLELISLIGNGASFLGLLFVYYQLFVVKSLSEASKLAAKNAEAAIYKITSIIDITKTIKEIGEIQNYNRYRKFELSISRIPELKETLHLIKSNPIYAPYIESSNIEDLIIEISIDKTTLEKFIQKRIQNIDIIKLNTNLENILDILHKIQPILRYEEPVNDD